MGAASACPFRHAAVVYHLPPPFSFVFHDRHQISSDDDDDDHRSPRIPPPRDHQRRACLSYFIILHDLSLST